MAELQYDLVPPGAGDALTLPETLGTAKESHEQRPGGAGTCWGLSWPSPALWEGQGDRRAVLMELEPGQGQARTPWAAAPRLGEPDARGQWRCCCRRRAGMQGPRRCGAGSGMLAGPGSLQAVSEPARSWDVSAVFAKS